MWKKWLSIGKEHIKGVLFFVFLIFGLQILIVWMRSSVAPVNFTTSELEWLATQKQIDSLNSTQKQQYTIYPFNPNFISDYKGYQLGMSTQEIDRLHVFRESNRYVNSAKEFQAVTQISDSLLEVIAPYFKFPDWVNQKSNPSFTRSSNYTVYAKPKIVINQPDINKTTAEDLIKIRGIGEVFASRILKYRESLGAFVSLDQLLEVYGMSPEVVSEVKKYFVLKDTTGIKKIKINEFSIKELNQFPYFKYPISKNIVAYRSMNGSYTKVEELLNVSAFSVENLKIIALYLEF